MKAEGTSCAPTEVLKDDVLSFVLTGDRRDLTLASKRKMSQRHRSSRASHSTQTDDISTVSTTPPVINGNGFHGSQPKMELVPCAQCRSAVVNGEFYEEQSAVYEKLLKSEEVFSRAECSVLIRVAIVLVVCHL